MKNIKLVLVCIIFIAGVIICSDCFAQRSVNSAQEAAKAARESLENRRNRPTSQIEWLDSVVSAVNMNEPKYKDVAAQNNKAIEEARGN